MKAWDIVAWAYEADLHCPDCAAKAGMVIEGAEDGEGNEPHPVFASDEQDGPQCCGDCGCVIE